MKKTNSEESYWYGKYSCRCCGAWYIDNQKMTKKDAMNALAEVAKTGKAVTKIHQCDHISIGISELVGLVNTVGPDWKKARNNKTKEIHNEEDK